MTRLSTSGRNCVKDLYSETQIEGLVKYKYNQNMFTMSEILKMEVKFTSMIIGYKIYQASQLDNILDGALQVVYETIKKETNMIQKR